MAQLKNSLQAFDLSAAQSNRIGQWYSHLRPNEIVFPTELSTEAQVGIVLSRQVMLTLALRKLVEPYTVPKVQSEVLTSFATKGYELVVSNDLVDELRHLGRSPSEIKAVTGFKKCASR